MSWNRLWNTTSLGATTTNSIMYFTHAVYCYHAYLVIEIELIHMTPVEY